ncbi:hypothetical protein C5S42_09220 [Candidatus Methanomarinus sp.]|jgi:hypothetical protein|nr:hypothetical protein C5S42_09220 [ANME-2 cluster archaeon]
MDYFGNYKSGQQEVNNMNTNVTNQKYSYSELGMIFGMFIGSGIGSSLDKRRR